MFVRETPCQTMACMIDQGLVDLETPEQSKVLSWIERISPDSELITDTVLQKEYDAFYDWIASAAECGACADTHCPTEGRRSFCDLDVEPSEPYDTTRDPGGCDDKTLEQLSAHDWCSRVEGRRLQAPAARRSAVNELARILLSRAE